MKFSHLKKENYMGNIKNFIFAVILIYQDTMKIVAKLVCGNIYGSISNRGLWLIIVQLSQIQFFIIKNLV